MWNKVWGVGVTILVVLIFLWTVQGARIFKAIRALEVEQTESILALDYRLRMLEKQKDEGE